MALQTLIKVQSNGDSDEKRRNERFKAALL